LQKGELGVLFMLLLEEEKFHELPLPPNIGSCFTGPLDFFSGV